MGFVLKLNVDTGRNDLSIIRPMVSDGLVAGFVPAKSLKDFTGNGYTLTKSGSPSTTAYGVKGDKSNGYLTNVPQTVAMTILAIYRVTAVGTDYSGMVAGVKGADTRGNTCSYLAVDVSSANIVNKSGSAAKEVSTGKSVLRQLSASTIGTASSGVTTPWVVGSVQISPPNEISSFSSTDSVITSNNNSAYSFVDRLMTDINGAPLYNKLIVNSGLVGAAQVELAEVLFYNRALTKDELITQTAYSKAYAQENFGITF